MYSKIRILARFDNPTATPQELISQWRVHKRQFHMTHDKTTVYCSFDTTPHRYQRDLIRISSPRSNISNIYYSEDSRLVLTSMLHETGKGRETKAEFISGSGSCSMLSGRREYQKKYRQFQITLRRYISHERYSVYFNGSVINNFL